MEGGKESLLQNDSCELYSNRRFFLVFSLRLPLIDLGELSHLIRMVPSLAAANLVLQAGCSLALLSAKFEL